MLYAPLDHDRNEIRLLRVISTAQLHCSLHTVSLVDKPAYDCISHCWGDPQVTETILINDHPLPVTINLAAALRNVHAKELWVDAICINQSDNEEKSKQVAKMGQIFASAARVHAWIVCPYGVNEERARKCRIGLQSLHKSKQRHLDEVALLWQNQYWKRVWMLQELSLAKAITICYGVLRHEFTFASLYQRVGHLILTSEQRNTRFINRFLRKKIDTSYLWLIMQELYRYQVVGKLSTSLLLFTPLNVECSIEHDRIYGLLSFLPADIVPDYDRPRMEVYTDVTYKMMLHTRNLTPLAASSKGDPSWMVDFASPQPWRRFYQAGRGGTFTLERFQDSLLVLGRLLGHIRASDELAFEGLSTDLVRFALRFQVTDKLDDAMLRTLLSNTDAEPSMNSYLKFTNDNVVRCKAAIEHELKSPKNLVLAGTSAYNGRSLTTESGIVGMASHDIRSGDQLCVIDACDVPFCVRPYERNGIKGYRLVSNCYADGIMSGEALGDSSPETLALI